MSTCLLIPLRLPKLTIPINVKIPHPCSTSSCWGKLHPTPKNGIQQHTHTHWLCIYLFIYIYMDRGSLSGYITRRVWPLLLFWTSTARSWWRLWRPTCLETAGLNNHTPTRRERRETLSTRITLCWKANWATVQYFPEDLRNNPPRQLQGFW